MNDFNGLYIVREGRETDKAFVLSTFLRGLYYGESFFSDIPKQIFMSKYRLVAQALVNDPNTAVKIACLPDDHDVILGYAIVSRNGDTLYYCFTKGAWRERGIAKGLIPKDIKYVAHLTKLGKSLLHKLPNAQLNPFF